MRSKHDIPAGTLHQLAIQSKILQDNFLGDPSARDVVVYTPHGHTGDGLPLLVDFAAYTSSGLAHIGWKNFGENLPERLDRLIAEGTLPPVVVAFPDCFTRLGGNQFIDSLAMGPWATYVTTELLDTIEGRFGCGGAGRRGCFGKSSGGYGAMVHGMLHADTWSAVACLSGDMAFDLCYQPAFPSALRAIQRAGSIENFIEGFLTGPKYPGSALHDLMTFAMAATYDPAPGHYCGVRLPVDLETCELIPDLWQNWLRWDPVQMVEQHQEPLKSLKCLWLECGTLDQYNLLYGARQLHRKLDDLGVSHIYREFEDNHSSLDYRLDNCLPEMAKALGA